MNTSSNQSLPPALLEEAAYYLTLLDERDLDHEEAMRFRTWLLASEQHRQAFEEVASLWGKMDVLQGLAEIIPIEETALLHPGDNKPAGRSGAWRYAMAASVLAAVIAITWYVRPGIVPAGDSAVDAGITEVVTSVGEQETIDMEDGSRILANTDSRLSVSFTESERRVILDKGEAFFEVEHDPGRSFDVIVDDTIVRAVGTAFSVYRNDDELKVVVSEGIVEVIRPARDNASEEHDLLSPGQVASFRPDDEEIVTIEQDELERKLFWRTGTLAFNGQPLEEVVAEFGRYNDITFEISSDDIRNTRVGGYYEANNVADMLTALQNTFGVQVTHLAPNHILLSSAADQP